MSSKIDGKSEAWRDAAHRLITALAKENKYIVSDMAILFLESAGYGLDDYSALGGAFRRAAKAGIIKKIEQPKRAKQSLWISTIYDTDKRIGTVPVLVKGQQVGFRGFGGIDVITYQIAEISGNVVTLEAIDAQGN